MDDKSKIIKTCAWFASMYKELDVNSVFEQGEYKIEKKELPKGVGPVRTTTARKIIEIGTTLENYPEPVIVYFLFWGFMMLESESVQQADEKAFFFMKSYPGFKESIMLILEDFYVKSAESSPEMLKRLENIVNNL